MDVYIGLDVSLASTAICAVSAQGKIVKETTAASEPEDLVATLKAMPGEVVAVGLEAGPLSQWLYRFLNDAGFATVLMETRQVKGALKSMPIKTDRRDAEGIARLLQMGWFRSVHCKSMSAQEMRALLSARKAVKQATINLELSIRGVLRNFGLKMGGVAKGRFEARVRELTEGNPHAGGRGKPDPRLTTGFATGTGRPGEDFARSRQAGPGLSHAHDDARGRRSRCADGQGGH